MSKHNSSIARLSSRVSDITDSDTVTQTEVPVTEVPVTAKTKSVITIGMEIGDYEVDSINEDGSIVVTDVVIPAKVARLYRVNKALFTSTVLETVSAYYSELEALALDSIAESQEAKAATEARRSLPRETLTEEAKEILLKAESIARGSVNDRVIEQSQIRIETAMKARSLGKLGLETEANNMLTQLVQAMPKALPGSESLPGNLRVGSKVTATTTTTSNEAVEVTATVV